MTSDVSPLRPSALITSPPRKKTAERENDVPSSELRASEGEYCLMDRPNCPACMQGVPRTPTTIPGSARARQSARIDDNREPGKLRHTGTGGVINLSPYNEGSLFFFAIAAEQGQRLSWTWGWEKAFRGNLLIRCHGDRTGHHIKSFSPTSGRRLWLLALYDR